MRDSLMRVLSFGPSGVKEGVVFEVDGLLDLGGQEACALRLDDLRLDFLLHMLAQAGDVLLVGVPRVRRDELGQELGVLVVGDDGDGVPARAQDAHH